jgi:L-malate glycosyltransferase
MRITFVLPFVHEGGGVRVILEHARGLIRLGHSVKVIYPGPTGATKRYAEPVRSARAAKYTIDALLGKREHVWFDASLPIRRVPDLRATSIPDGDIVIATSNETADWVKEYPNRCGIGAYFIQDYETWNRPVEKVDATWRYPLERLTISRWLADLAEQRFNVPIRAIIPNGIDTSHFYPEPDIAPSSRTTDIVMIWRAAPQKGCERGLAILEKVREQRPETTFAFFGRDDAPDRLRALGPVIQRPSQDEIRRQYSAARIFFLPSFQEGFSLTPMEATACGCATVSTAVGGPADILADGSGWLAPAEDTEALTQALLEALADPSACDTRAAAARQRLAAYTWERATAMLESALTQILADAHS